jgi:hypothetical protein
MKLTAHTKQELLTSRREKGSSIMGPGYDGAPKPGHYSDTPVLLSHPHSVANAAGLTDQTHVKADLGRAPKIKRAFTDQIPIHGGMEGQSSQGATFGGDHKSALDALTGLAVVPDKSGKVAAEHPLSKPPVAKGYKVPEFSPGMRSRTTFDPPFGGGEPGEHHNRAQRHKDVFRADHLDLGRRVIDEALAVAGSDHPENMARRGRK